MIRNAIVLMIIAMLVASQTAFAQSSSPSELDSLTIDIIRKETELLKLNANLRWHQLPNPWSGRRWWVFNMAGVSLTAIGAYINGAGRFSYLHTSRRRKAPRYLFVNAGWCRVTANAIMTGGGLIESAALAYKDYKDKRDGVNLPVMRRYADSLQSELDGLIAQRESIVNSLPSGSPDRHFFESEGQVLKDIRDLAINEFVRYYSQTKGSRGFFYSTYLWAATSNAVAGAGGIVGNIAASTTKGTARSRTRLGGTGGITDIISGGMNQATPLVVRVAAYLSSNSSKKQLCKQLDCVESTKLDQLHEHQERYHQLASTSPRLGVHGIVVKDGLFAKTTDLFDQHEKIRLGDVKARKRRLNSQLIFFSGIGAPKLVNGIGTTVGAFEYTNNSYDRFKAIGGPALAYGAGYSVALAELVRYQLVNEVQSIKDKRAGTSSGQVLKRELADLEQVLETLKD